MRHERLVPQQKKLSFFMFELLRSITMGEHIHRKIFYIQQQIDNLFFSLKLEWLVHIFVFDFNLNFRATHIIEANVNHFLFQLRISVLSRSSIVPMYATKTTMSFHPLVQSRIDHFSLNFDSLKTRTVFKRIVIDVEMK